MHCLARAISTCLCCLVFALSAAAQNKTMTGEFRNTKFPDFVKQAEAGNTFHFYYNEAELDSFAVNVKLVDQTIADALQQIFPVQIFAFQLMPATIFSLLKTKVYKQH